MYRHLAAAAALIGAAGLAQAQAPSLVEVEDETMQVEAFGMTVDQVEDMDITGPGGERIGEVDEVLMDAQNRIVAVSAEVGGFLGIGEREIVIDLGQLRLADGVLATDLARDQVEAMDTWDD